MDRIILLPVAFSMLSSLLLVSYLYMGIEQEKHENRSVKHHLGFVNVSSKMLPSKHLVKHAATLYSGNAPLQKNKFQ